MKDAYIIVFTHSKQCYIFPVSTTNLYIYTRTHADNSFGIHSDNYLLSILIVTVLILPYHSPSVYPLSTQLYNLRIRSISTPLAGSYTGDYCSLSAYPIGSVRPH